MPPPPPLHTSRHEVVGHRVARVQLDGGREVVPCLQHLHDTPPSRLPLPTTTNHTHSNPKHPTSRHQQCRAVPRCVYACACHLRREFSSDVVLHVQCEYLSTPTRTVTPGQLPTNAITTITTTTITGCHPTAGTAVTATTPAHCGII